MAKLTGPKLLEFLEINKGYERDKLIEGAGYTSSRGGKTSLQRTKFFEALAAANGHQLGASPTRQSNLQGKAATYRLKVGPNGLIPLSRAYTSQCDMAPGSYVTVQIEDGALIVEPDVAEAEAVAEAAPPVACLAAA